MGSGAARARGGAPRAVLEVAGRSAGRTVRAAAAPQADAPPAEQVVGSAVVSDVARDGHTIEALYDSVVTARRAVGAEGPFPFHRFAQIVKGQVSKLQQAGTREVAFRVSVKDGKVAFTARGVKASDEDASS